MLGFTDIYIFFVKKLPLLKKIVLLWMVILANQLHAQQLFKGIIKNTNTFLAGAMVIATNGHKKISAVSDEKGFFILTGLSAGTITIEVSFTGYATKEITAILPDTSIHFIALEENNPSLDNVTVVASTRSGDPIETATTKVEVLGITEMNEESTLKPGNIASILGDVSGVQIQQSSATSGNSNVRIQGLDGRYTQILRDGMPLFGGYSGGFGVLSIPPLDLKQVELIKGSSSTLYGGGAIAGLINLLSKKPTYKPEASFLINQSTLKETNVNGYYAQRWKKVGLTLFGGQTFQKQVDVNKDGLSDVPNIKSTIIHPTLFFYPSNKTYFSLGWSGGFEKRTGGDMIAVAGIADTSHPYFEKNNLHRNTFTLIGESRPSNTLTLVLKANISIFKREEIANTYNFFGKQNSYYTEASLVKKAGEHTIFAGVNFTGDKFAPSARTPVPVGALANHTIGIFTQDSWKLLKNTKIEAGLRADHHDKYGNFLLPRIAVFRQIDSHWGARAGFGMGYTTPNPLTPQIKDYSIYDLLPLTGNITAERSYGGNVDINYKTTFGAEGNLLVDQSFFITKINNPVIGMESDAGLVSFHNQTKPILTQGSDTYVKIEFQGWEFYIGYTYTNALRKYLDKNQFMPITPRHRAAATAVYELEGKWRTGIEASYNGHQYRQDGSKTNPYLFMAAMVERKFGPKWSLVLNCENLFDERQSKHETLYNGNIKNPSFKELWAPIDGRAINLCLRLQPFAKKD